MRHNGLKTIVLSLLLLLGGHFAAPIPPALAAEEPQTVRVGMYDNKPKLWMDEKGVAQGFFSDVMNAIAEMENWQIEYVPGTWDEGLRRLAANEIDIMPDVAVSEERQKLYDFNEETVLVSWGVFYTRAGVTLQSIKELEGKRIAVMKAGILYSGPLGLKNLLDSFGINADIIDVKVYGDVFDLLDKGEADIGVVNQAFGIANEKNFAVQRTNVIFYPSELKFALTKGVEKNAHLIARIDADLKWLKDNTNSVYHKSLTRHLGGIVETVEVFPRWFKYLVLGILAALLAAAAYILLLRAIRRRLEALVEARIADVKKERNQFRSTFFGSNEPLLLFDDASQEVIECNQAAWKLFGVSRREDLIGKKVSDLTAPVQLDGRPTAEVVKDMQSRVLKDGGATVDWISRRADGTNLFTIITLTPLEWEGKKAMHISLHDITDRKAAAARELELGILRETAKTKDEFLFRTIHDLRSPANIIRLALREYVGDSDKLNVSDEVKKALDVMREAVSRMMRLIEDLFDIAKGEKAEIALKRDSLDLAGLIRKMLDGLTPSMKAADVRAVYEPPAGLPAVTGDADALKEVLDNLINNAVKYNKRGGTITVTHEVEGSFLKTSVQDTGIGISETALAKLFRPYFRAVGNEIQGTGLGLYIVKKLVEKMGGAISVQSIYGQGTKFTVSLPLAVDPK